MPGVSTLTGTRPGASSSGIAPAAAFMVAGLTARGDTTQAVKVRSLSELVALFGPRVSYGYVHDQLEAYFNDGGTVAYVARVVGASATAGVLVLADRSASAGLTTLTLTAKSPGAWSSLVTVAVVDGPSTNTFAVIITYTPTTGPAVVETFGNLPDPATAAARITAQSAFVTAVDNGSATASPANNPRVLAATALSAGADDRASVTAAIVAAAANSRFPVDLGPGAVACPGYDAVTVGPILAAPQMALNRIVLLAPPIGSTSTGVRTSAAAVRSIPGSEACGIFYPWVQVPDGNGGLRTIPPEGMVAGLRARAHVQDGPGQAPAGGWGQSRHVVGVETVVDRPTGDALNADQVSCVRIINGVVKLYGYRSLNAADPANYLMLTSRDVLNVIAGMGAVALERLAFLKLDGSGHAFDQLATTMLGICQPLRDNGDLYERHVGDDPNGALIDPGFRIDAGPDVNTVASIAAGAARVVVAARPSPTAELILLTVTRVGLNQAA